MVTVPRFTAMPCDHCESSGIEPGTACQECAFCHDSGYGVVLPVKVPMVARRPKGCICAMFCDTNGVRIADLTCPIHGVSGSIPGDGPWPMVPDPSWDPDQPCDTCGGDGIDGSHEAALYYAYSGEIPSCDNCRDNPGRRTAPIVTPCPGHCADCYIDDCPDCEACCEDGYKVVGRCSWTLAPVVGPYFQRTEMRTYVKVLRTGPVLHNNRITTPLDLDVNRGDVVAIPEVTS